MDDLGARIIADRAEIAMKRDRANYHEREAKRLRWDADDMERLLELARHLPQANAEASDG